MIIHIKKVTKFFIGGIIILSLSGCNIENEHLNKKEISLSLEKIFLNCDSTSNETGRIIFMVELQNNSDTTINIANEDTAQIVLGNKFLMVSNSDFPDGLELLLKTRGNTTRILKQGKGYINLVVELDKLKYNIEKYRNEKISFSALKSFLLKGEYSLVNLNFQSKKSYFISISKSLTCSCDYY
jgi:hypothetical protein